MNSFLNNLDVTFRRDPTNYRPRINKPGSTKDREQKDAGTYYYIDEVGPLDPCRAQGEGLGVRSRGREQEGAGEYLLHRRGAPLGPRGV